MLESSQKSTSWHLKLFVGQECSHLYFKYFYVSHVSVIIKGIHLMNDHSDCVILKAGFYRQSYW
jgi:hypothetical protein